MRYISLGKESVVLGSIRTEGGDVTLYNVLVTENIKTFRRNVIQTGHTTVYGNIVIGAVCTVTNTPSKVHISSDSRILGKLFMGSPDERLIDSRSTQMDPQQGF
ncbi:hypothetical protein [Paraglaciecola sp. L1A13]|uniref:hypothetical protein n=1 Tax=Paraglaciecola sp. L1A13 TaxID=2686359 RepID=UPI00131E72C7|nr:hypothetical protein [Paraglaciecola sp. L1A13]